MPQTPPDSPSIDAVRRTLVASSDPRVARTRAAIVEAVHTLVAEDRESITVADILATSGVSRGSFYSHFTSLDELALSILDTTFAQIAREDADLRASSVLSPYETLRVSQVRLVAHFVENRALYTTVLSLPITHSSHRAAVASMSGPILDTIRAMHTVPAGIVPEVAATYIAHAATGTLEAWLRDELPATAEQLVDHLMCLLPAWFSQAT